MGSVSASGRTGSPLRSASCAAVAGCASASKSPSRSKHRTSSTTANPAMASVDIPCFIYYEMNSFNMNLRKRQQAETRRAILSAVGQVLVADGVLGFSMQKVADEAGVTHRTVYNYFPTRESLNDAFAEYVEEEMAKLGSAPDQKVELKMVPN